MRPLAFAACLLAVGCRKDPTPDLEQLAARACACVGPPAPAFGEVGWKSGGVGESWQQSRACANQVLADFTRLVESNASANADEDSEPGAFLAARRMASCLLAAGADVNALRGVKAAGRIVGR